MFPVKKDIAASDYHNHHKNRRAIVTSLRFVFLSLVVLVSLKIDYKTIGIFFKRMRYLMSRMDKNSLHAGVAA